MGRFQSNLLKNNILEAFSERYEDYKASRTSKYKLKKMLEAKNKRNISDSIFMQRLERETGLSREELYLSKDEMLNLDAVINDDSNEVQDDKSESTEEKSTTDVFNETLETIFDNENIIKEIDLDGDSKLNKDEKLQYLNSILELDGEDGNLSMKDIMSSVVGILSGKTLDEVKEEKALERANGASSENGIDSTSGASNNGPVQLNTHPTNYTAPDDKLDSKNAEDKVKEADAKIQAATAELVSKNEEKAKALKDDEIYTGLITELNKATSVIPQTEAKITGIESELHTIEFDITAKQNELDNIQDPQIFKEQQKDVDNRRESLRSEIESLKNKQNQKQSELENERKNLEAQQKEKESLENQVAQYEAKNPNEQINEINTQITEIKSAIETLEQEKKTAQGELNQVRKTEIDENAPVFGKAQAFRQSEIVKHMMDYATSDECKRMFDERYAKNPGAYCAVFTKEITQRTFNAVVSALGLSDSDLKTMMSGYGDKNDRAQGITGSSVAMNIESWGYMLQPALDSLGINAKGTIDITNMSEQDRMNAVRTGKIHPGQTFTYKNAQGRYHTGFIESINPNMTFNTIEGNTVVKYDDGTRESNTVGAHRRDMNYPDLHAVSDATLKVACWIQVLNDRGIIDVPDSYIDSLYYSA